MGGKGKGVERFLWANGVGILAVVSRVMIVLFACLVLWCRKRSWSEWGKGL